jgi:hypothetical protein
MIGLTNIQVNIVNSWLLCSFTRQTSLPSQSLYYDLNNQFYILAAFGSLDANGIFLKIHIIN